MVSLVTIPEIVPDARVLVFDTSLRDGEQAPGCMMTRDEKLEVARQLARLGVDVVEAGFPAASPGDWESVRAVAEEVGTADGPIICGLARANRDDVEFSPEDATRSDLQFLYHALRQAILSGATTLNIPDTVGYATPNEYHALIRGIRTNVLGCRHVVISTHCHDDLGLAVANTLAGVHAGARQVECTINGIGERAGNASLEEVVMAIHTRRQLFNVNTGINTREITRTSRLVSMCTGVQVPPNKAVVGANAFAHEAGIHQDGVLKHRLTYEIMSAETVGLDGNVLVLGKHSGRHAFRRHLETRGHHLSEQELTHAFARFKEIADKKKLVDERDIEAIVVGEARRAPPIYTLEQASVTCGTHTTPTATVQLRGPDGVVRAAAAQGTGPVDAICQAVNEIVGEPGELVEFAVNAITEGFNAVGEVTIRLKERGP